MKLESFAENIKRLRNLRGLTQFALAELIDKSPETISQIERAKIFPSFETLKLLATALNVDMREFFEVQEAIKINQHDKNFAELVAVANTLNSRELAIALIQIKALKIS